jgi:hypothetical protein
VNTDRQQGSRVSAPAWERYEAGHGFAIERPGEWIVLEDILGTQVAFCEPEHTDPLAFRANLNVVVRDLPDGFDPPVIFQAQVDDLARALTDPVLIDVEAVAIAGQPGQRVLVAHRDAIYALTLEQWCVIAGGRSYLVS